MSDRRSFLLRGGSVVTCDRKGRVLEADVLVQDGVITQIGKCRAPSGLVVHDVRDHVVVPGLVMTHLHLCQALMRGLADDMPLLHWLKRRIWPMEAAHDERSLRASAELGLAEMITAGVTTILDLGTVHHQAAVFDACVRSGVRVFGGKSLMDSGDGVPRRLRQSTQRELQDAERLQREWSGHESGRVRYVWIPRFILSSSEGLERGALERALDSSTLFHTHAAEHPGERAAVRAALGADDVSVLRRWGMRGRHTSIAHGVQLTPAQIRRLAADRVGVVHCPSANLKLGSGIAPVHALRAAGVVVGIGPDGAPCNNNMDPWVEMRHAALLASIKTEPAKLRAADVLRMATIDGARLLGADKLFGSIELSKRADLLVVRRDAPHVAPALGPETTLVYASQARDVRHVFVDGRQLVKDGELLSLDAERVAATAREAAPRLLRKAGL